MGGNLRRIDVSLPFQFCSALSLGRFVKTLWPAECAGVSKLHFAGAIRDLPQIVPRAQVRRSEDLPNQLQVADQGETEPLRRQALHPRPAGAQEWPVAEVGGDHLAYIHRDREGILSRAGIAAPVHKTLPRIRHCGQRNGLVGGISVGLRIQVDPASAIYQNRQRRLVGRQNAEDRRDGLSRTRNAEVERVDISGGRVSPGAKVAAGCGTAVKRTIAP